VQLQRNYASKSTRHIDIAYVAKKPTCSCDVGIFVVIVRFVFLACHSGKHPIA
jgi:hypothetical protein